MAKHLGVIEAHRGNGAGCWVNDVGGVEAPAQSHFNDGPLDLALHEVDECQGRHHLECSAVWLTLQGRLAAMQQIDEVAARDGASVDAYALAEGVEMGGCEEARAIPV